MEHYLSAPIPECMFYVNLVYVPQTDCTISVPPMPFSRCSLVMTAAHQYEGTEGHWTVQLNIAKIVCFILCDFCHTHTHKSIEDTQVFWLQICICFSLCRKVFLGFPESVRLSTAVSPCSRFPACLAPITGWFYTSWVITKLCLFHV